MTVMKFFLPIFVLTFLTCCMPNWFGKKSLSSEMQRLDVDTVLLVNSQAIDEYPLWSPNSDFVATNIMGTWYKFNLENIELIGGDWHEHKIGVAVNTDGNGLLLTQFEQKEFQKKTSYDPRVLVTTNGDKIELKLDVLSTSLVVTRVDKLSETLWKSGLENCHSLSLSPNQNYIAYLCELNGLFVMKIK